MPKEMKAKKLDGRWWLINVPDSVTEYGPYDTRAEAEESKRGLERTFKALEDGTFGRHKW